MRGVLSKMEMTTTTEALKVAISGKGGVGKTTLSALLARSLACDGHRVIAVDADPDANLGVALGLSREVLSDLTPLSKMGDLIEERTGARPGSMGGWFSLNPRVDDLPERLWVQTHGVRLIVMGGIQVGGGGCACPETAILKAFLAHLILERGESVLIDMEAGLEPLGRGAARGVGYLLVVVEPGARSIDTAQRIQTLSQDIGIDRVYAVANKVKSKNDLLWIQESLRGMPLSGWLPYDDTILDADRSGKGVWGTNPLIQNHVTEIRNEILRFCINQTPVKEVRTP